MTRMMNLNLPVSFSLMETVIEIEGKHVTIREFINANFEEAYSRAELGDRDAAMMMASILGDLIAHGECQLEMSDTPTIKLIAWGEKKEAV